MGLPFYYSTFSSLSDVYDFIRMHPDDLKKATVTVGGVHVRDIFKLVEVLMAQEDTGFVVENIDLVLDEGRKFALYVEDCDSTTGEALTSIQEDASITANLAEDVRKAAVKFLDLVSGQPIYDFFRGFAQYMVRVGDEAVEAAATLAGEEVGNEDGAAEGEDEGADPDGDEAADANEGGHADGDEGAVADGDEAVQAPSLVHLRGELLQTKAALERLLELRLIFELPGEKPITYPELADFADSFPVDPEPDAPPAVPDDDIAAQQAPEE